MRNTNGSNVVVQPYGTVVQAVPVQPSDPDAHRFSTVIVKDCVVNPAPNPMTQPGQGVVDLPDMMAILSESGFDGPLLIEKLPGKSLAELDGNMAAALDFCQALPSAPTDEPEIDPRAGSTLLPSSVPAPALTAAQVAPHPP